MLLWEEKEWEYLDLLIMNNKEMLYNIQIIGVNWPRILDIIFLSKM